MTTNTPAFSAPRHVDLVETAKLIRRHLASAFPGQKFSVRTERFSMGTAANVSWTDGPTVAQVGAITDAFASSSFDGSVDSGYVVSSWYCPEHGASIRHTDGTEGQRGSVPSIDEVSCCLGAEPVVFGAKFVCPGRILSDDFRALLVNDLEAAGKYPYNDSFKGRIPGIEGPGEDTAIYLLQHTRHMREYQAKVDAYLADGFEPLDVFPETATRFAGVVHYGWRNGEDGIAEWSDARLLTFDGQRVVLPKGKRTKGYRLDGKVLVKR